MKRQRVFLHIYVRPAGPGAPIRPGVVKLGRELSEDEMMYRIIDGGYWGCVEISTFWQRVRLVMMLHKKNKKADTELAWLQSMKPQFIAALKEAAGQRV